MHSLWGLRIVGLRADSTQIAPLAPGCYHACLSALHHDAYLDSLMSFRSSFIPFCLLLAVVASSTIAAPYVPISDAMVLERLPFKPNDPIVAVQLARRYYGWVAEEGDPRYLGYAQAALSPWWDMREPPIEVQVLRASLAQFRHDFAGALADLTQVLNRDPLHPQARALRATIHIVQARYAEARADCRALQDISSDLIALGCTAMVDGLTGNAESAHQALNSALMAHPEATIDEKLWVLTRLAEMSQRLGKFEATEEYFKRALALGVTDTFLLAAYADFLLDQKRAVDVVKLLKDKTRSDTLLLRLVFAERTLNLPTAKEREATLTARYAAAQLRGDTVHQQEEARFALQVQKDAAKALKLAQENWKVQLEPRDARIFLEACIALGDLSAAQPVLKWLDDNHNEDRYLIGLAQRLKGMGR